MKINWIIEEKDIKRITEFLELQRPKSFVRNRIKKNVSNSSMPSYNEDIFWDAMISCLLTTQQRSGPDSPVTRFISSKPFPLSLTKCSQADKLQTLVDGIITEFGGIRRAKTIGLEIESNYQWLINGGWIIINSVAELLIQKRKQDPCYSDNSIERRAVTIANENLKGFGPKQSRNLWQSLGLTRFEIPIDSRITKWLNNIGFPINVTSSSLSDPNFYNFIMDGIQEICKATNELPCVLDASIFASYDQEWPEERLIW